MYKLHVFICWMQRFHLYKYSSMSFSCDRVQRVVSQQVVTSCILRLLMYMIPYNENILCNDIHVCSVSFISPGNLIIGLVYGVLL